MGKMKLYELVNQYHIGTNLSCAEAMFKACNEYYHLHLSEETRRMFSVMGIGMQTEQSCCGAFTVAVGIIGLMTAKDGETDADNIEGYRMIYDLTGHVLEVFGTLHCMELQGLEIEGEENPCHVIVEEIARKLEEILSGGHEYSQMLVN
ncbi:C-GCAxxG-C-C family protein [Anaerotignum lactatifermentans]